MSNDYQENITSLSCEERYDYFLSMVGDEKEIWILINADKQFLKIYAEEDGFEYLPIWPNSGLASDYAKGSADLVPKGISLPEFSQKVDLRFKTRPIGNRCFARRRYDNLDYRA